MTIRIGDKVRLLGMPDWLIHDLPPEEQVEMRSFIGNSTRVEDIDKYGYYWLGFSFSFVVDNTTYYSGHSFVVTREFIEPDHEDE